VAGLDVLVDKEYEWLLNKYSWYIHTRGYVCATEYLGQYRRKDLKLHRLIMSAQPGQIIDHINGNKRDNRKSNLRFCTQAENCRNNQNVRKNKTSKYKGVSWCEPRKAWLAQIQLNKKKTMIGLYKTQEEAAKAYDKKALELFGEYANLNFKE